MKYKAMSYLVAENEIVRVMVLTPDEAEVELAEIKCIARSEIRNGDYLKVGKLKNPVPFADHYIYHWADWTGQREGDNQ